MNATSIFCAVALCISSASSAFAGVTVAEGTDSKLTLGANIFADYTQNKTVTNGATTARNMGANVSRSYFMVDYDMDKAWSAHVILDASYESALTGKKTNIFVKNAYIQGRMAPEAIITLGIIPTPWVGYENSLDKHRYVSKAYADTMGFDQAADAGIGLSGKVADGLFNYHLTAINGKGFTDVQATDGRDYNGRIGLNSNGFTLDAGYRTGYMGTKTFTAAANTIVKSTLTQTMATYGADNFRVGANYITNKKINQGTQNKIDDKCIETWAWASIADGSGIFARYETTDTKDPATAAGVTQKTKRFVAGAEHKYGKYVTIALAIDQKDVTNNAFTTGNTLKVTKIGLFTNTKF